jgi:hypothetical protein
MPIPVFSFGSIAAVRDIPVGKIIVVPTSDGTAIAMIVRAPPEHQSKYLAWLSDPPRTDEKRFGRVDTAHYLNNKAVVVDDAAIELSPEPRHLLAWESQRIPGIVVRTETHHFLYLDGDARTRIFVDLASGLFVSQPSEELSALAYTSWSLVRRYEQDGRTITFRLFKWPENKDEQK